MRHGHPSWPIPHRPYYGPPENITTFIHLQNETHWLRRYLRWNRNKKLRELIGPPEFDGPLYTDQFYVGEIVNGRVYNGVCHLNYLCRRGMTDETFRRDIATLYRFIDHMKRCSGPVLP